MSIVIDYVSHGQSHVTTIERIASANHGSGAIVVGDGFDDLQRIRITNVIGKTLELLPPFPRGTPPDGPIGVTF